MCCNCYYTSVNLPGVTWFLLKLQDTIFFCLLSGDSQAANIWLGNWRALELNLPDFPGQGTWLLHRISEHTWNWLDTWREVYSSTSAACCPFKKSIWNSVIYLFLGEVNAVESISLLSSKPCDFQSILFCNFLHFWNSDTLESPFLSFLNKCHTPPCFGSWIVSLPRVLLNNDYGRDGELMSGDCKISFLQGKEIGKYFAFLTFHISVRECLTLITYKENLFCLQVSKARCLLLWPMHLSRTS